MQNINKITKLFLFGLIISLNASSQSIPQLGFASSLSNDSLLYNSGFKLIGESVSKMLSPGLTDEQFQKNMTDMKNAKCKVYMCNVFFPATIKIAGSDVKESRVLQYADSVFLRAKQAGIPVIVLGSGGARKLPEGYDAKKATADFIFLASKLGKAAQRRGITVVLENLNRTETNFINTLKEAAYIVKTVDHPNFRLNADIYHMLKENEPPQEIINAGKLIVYSEVAEKEKRTLPGVMKDDFRPYFMALKQIGFKGNIIVEGKTDNLAAEAPAAYKYLQQQLKEAYSRKNN